MEGIQIFKDYISNSCLTPGQLGELNTLIFHEWDESKAKEVLPLPVIEYISKNQKNESILDEIYHLLLPVDLRSE